VVETLASELTDEEIVGRAILKDVSESEDVMQEAYVRAFMHLHQFAGEARFSTWPTKIAVYEALGA
jgi:RNA polymerase sigma-70 factor (ECF subfamily)